MNFRTRSSAILVAVSLLFAGIAAVLANRWMNERTAAVEATRPRTTRVVVAATDIPFGTSIEARHLASVDMLVNAVTSGSYSQPSVVIGKVARSDIYAGEMLLERRVVARGEGSTLAAVVSPNMRAVTVRVDDVVGVAGFLLPGNRVDVVAAREENRKAYAETILDDVRVLAVDQVSNADKNAPMVVRAVTLEVNPEGALAIARARQLGSLQLTLRNPHEGSGTPGVIRTAEVPLAPMPPIDIAPPRPMPVARHGVAAMPRVTVIRGTVVSQTAE